MVAAMEFARDQAEYLRELSRYEEAALRGAKTVADMVDVKLGAGDLVDRTYYYTLEVRKGEQSWIVQRSYPEFRRFERILRKRLPRLPSLPRSGDLLVRMSQRCRTRRAAALAAFLVAVVGEDPLLQSCELRAFLRREVATTQVRAKVKVDAPTTTMTAETLQACLKEALTQKEFRTPSSTASTKADSNLESSSDFQAASENTIALDDCWTSMPDLPKGAESSV